MGCRKACTCAFPGSGMAPGLLRPSGTAVKGISSQQSFFCQFIGAKQPSKKSFAQSGGLFCGRGRRIRTLNKGFGDPRVTITPCPYTQQIDYTKRAISCQEKITRVSFRKQRPDGYLSYFKFIFPVQQTGTCRFFHPAWLFSHSAAFLKHNEPDSVSDQVPPRCPAGGSIIYSAGSWNRAVPSGSDACRKKKAAQRQQY